MPIEFRILGPLELSADGRLLLLGSPKQRALLALLLIHANEAVSRERLIEELWAEAAPASVESAFHVYLSRLRRLLESAGAGGALIREAHGYRLQVEPEQLDVNRFDHLVGEGSEALAAGKADVASERLRQALALWRGPALADLQSEHFASIAAARLEERRVSAIEQRLEADLALARHRQMIGELETLVAEHPYRERLRAQLMLALYRSGRQAEALRVYQEARRTLVDELGIEPSVQLQRLEKAILNQNPSLEAPTGVTLAPSGSALGFTGTATVLFVDLVDSERFLSQLPPDHFDGFVAEYHRLLRAVFADFGGRELGSFYDTVSAAFESAVRAAAAAMAAQRALDAFQPQLAIKVGLDAGDAAALSWSSPVALRSAQLCNAAAGRQILLSEAVAHLLDEDSQGKFELRDLGERSLGAVPGGQVRVYELVVPDFSTLDQVTPSQTP
jgi:DNA-binding SARP family transcriptional activator